MKLNKAQAKSTKNKTSRPSERSGTRSATFGKSKRTKCTYKTIWKTTLRVILTCLLLIWKSLMSSAPLPSLRIKTMSRPLRSSLCSLQRTKVTFKGSNRVNILKVWLMSLYRTAAVTLRRKKPRHCKLWVACLFLKKSKLKKSWWKSATNFTSWNGKGLSSKNTKSLKKTEKKKIWRKIKELKMW